MKRRSKAGQLAAFVRLSVRPALFIGPCNPIFLFARSIRNVIRSSERICLSREKFAIKSYGQIEFFKGCLGGLPLGPAVPAPGSGAGGPGFEPGRGGENVEKIEKNEFFSGHIG